MIGYERGETEIDSLYARLSALEDEVVTLTNVNKINARLP
jgi:hypothetical protein